VRQRDAFVDQFVDLFPDVKLAPYLAGADRALVGRPISAFRTVRRAGGRVELDGAEAIAAANPKGAVVPTFVSGQLSGVRVGEKLAVSVNGRIVTTTYSFTDRGRTAFTALVPPSDFRRGENRVQVLAVQGSAPGATLATLGQTAGDRFALVHEGGGLVLKSSSGKQAKVVSGAVAGFLDDVNLLPGGVVVSGWAAAPQRGPADRIVVYINGRAVAVGVPTLDRKDVASERGAMTLKSGFELSGNDPEGGTPSRSDVHVYAVYGDKASEIK
jgi:hypothetical protein